MEKEERKILILGIGNVLMGDEGVGVHAIRRLEESAGEFPPNVELLDGGTGSLTLLEPMQEADRIILMDATIDGKSPGSITRLTPRYSSDYPPGLTAHDLGLKDLLDAFQLMGKEPEVTLFTVTIDELKSELTMELSPSIESVLPELCRLILDEAKIASPA